MRRIYESDALARDGERPFTPHEREEGYAPRSFRSLDASAWSDRLVPHALRRRFVSVRISTPRSTFERGEAVPFLVTMTNRAPVPLTIRTASPIRWTWAVDGLEEASSVEVREPPDRPATLHFDRGERKRFRRRWSQSFRVGKHEWRPADPGTYTIRAAINVDAPEATGLAAETTVRIVS